MLSPSLRKFIKEGGTVTFSPYSNGQGHWFRCECRVQGQFVWFLVYPDGRYYEDVIIQSLLNLRRLITEAKYPRAVLSAIGEKSSGSAK